MAQKSKGIFQWLSLILLTKTWHHSNFDRLWPIPAGKSQPFPDQVEWHGFIIYTIEITMNALVEELKVKLISLLNLTDITPEEFSPDARLVGGDLGIDSIDVLEMVVMVEKDYGVLINNQEVGEKVFASLTTLADYISAHREGTAS
jgi:acyl carrier protein